jgi:hypothetical protein
MKKLLFFLLLFVSLQLNAQQVTEPARPGSDIEMADAMRKDGKIYIVVAVVATIMAGIIVYLVRLDNKISKLEEEVSSQQETYS